MAGLGMGIIWGPVPLLPRHDKTSRTRHIRYEVLPDRACPSEPKTSPYYPDTRSARAGSRAHLDRPRSPVPCKIATAWASVLCPPLPLLVIRQLSHTVRGP